MLKKGSGPLARCAQAWAAMSQHRGPQWQLCSPSALHILSKSSRCLKGSIKCLCRKDVAFWIPHLTIFAPMPALHEQRMTCDWLRCLISMFLFHLC